MQLSRCSPRLDAVALEAVALSYSHQHHDLPVFGGDDRARTGDLLRARQPLSQLSYVPNPTQPIAGSPVSCRVVGRGRLELPTSPLSGARSSRLSYRPAVLFHKVRCFHRRKREGPMDPSRSTSTTKRPYLRRPPANRRIGHPSGYNGDPSKLNSVTRQEPGTDLVGLRRALDHILRKEVIQPHLPVRLPCYDLVPITGLTFGHRSGLRALPAFVT